MRKIKHGFQATINNSHHSACHPCCNSDAELCCTLTVFQFCVLVATLSLSSLMCIQIQIRANYDFSVLFYDFHNPTNLGCDECCRFYNETKRCCDDLDRTSNCSNQDCDTQFRFRLFPYTYSAQHVGPNMHPDYLPLFRVASFMLGVPVQQGLTGLRNSSTIVNRNPWTVS